MVGESLLFWSSEKNIGPLSIFSKIDGVFL